MDGWIWVRRGREADAGRAKRRLLTFRTSIAPLAPPIGARNPAFSLCRSLRSHSALSRVSLPSASVSLPSTPPLPSSMSLRAAGRLARRPPPPPALSARGLRLGLGYVPQSVRPFSSLPSDLPSPRSLTPTLPPCPLAGRDRRHHAHHAPGQAAALLLHRQAQPVRPLRPPDRHALRGRAPVRGRAPLAAARGHARHGPHQLEVEEPGGDARDRQRHRVRPWPLALFSLASRGPD